MPDRDIVAAIIAGDPAGLAAAYDSYAAGLFGYCRSLLGEPADAADAVQDTFVIAAIKLSGLRNPARFRSWLYAVARNECHGRLRAQARQANPDQAGEMTDDVDNVVGFAQRDELRRLMTDAIAGLNPGDREVIELNLRHDLGGADLAGVLGVPAAQAHALASRARAQLERALGALLVARTGRRDCIELDAILDSWDGKLTALWRKRVNRHVEGCDICSERKREVLSPAMLLSVLPLVPLPAGLRDHLMRLVCDDSAEAVGYRGRVVSRAGAFDPAGFPVQVASVAVPGRSGRGRGGPGADGSGRAGAAGGSAAGGSAAGRRHAGERSMLVLLAAAGALVLLLGGGVATTYALLAGHGHAKATVHRKDLAGAISTTAPPAPPSSPSAVPPPSPSPPPVSAPTEPAVVPTTAPPKTSPPAKSPTPTPTKSASPSPSPSPSPSTTVPIPPPTSSTPPVSSSPPVSPTTSAAAARGLGMIEAIDSLRLT